MSGITVRKENNDQVIPLDETGWHPIRKIKDFFKKAQETPQKTSQETPPETRQETRQEISPQVPQGAEQELARNDTESDDFLPTFEVKDTPNSYLFTATVGGVKEDDLEVNVIGNCLMIKGQREKDNEEKTDDYYLSEYSVEGFSRSFVLPPQIDAEHISATLKNGVLAVEVPKKA
jgi:HSP20 family molecular chaperone IbpA